MPCAGWCSNAPGDAANIAFCHRGWPSINEPDHIIPRQHGGQTGTDNLALACVRCNRYKGPNVGSFDSETGELVPFFNPRTQVWAEHFQLEGGAIRPVTAQARVTVKLFRLNDPDRGIERQGLIAARLYS